MNINYKKLWKLLIDKDLKKSQLKELAQISQSTLMRLNRNEYVSLEVLVKICIALDCEISDIVEIER